MIKSIKVESKHDNVRVANAVKSDLNDEFDYLLEFVPNRNSVNFENNVIVGKTILRHQIHSPLLLSHNFRLNRGLYDVIVTQIDSISESEIKLVEETKQKYDKPVMVGGKYVIRVKLTPTSCYGTNGLRIQIISDEVELDSKSMYYSILKEELNNIRYYIPFNNSKKIDFFVKGAVLDNFILNLENPSFEIQYV